MFQLKQPVETLEEIKLKKLIENKQLFDELSHFKALENTIKKLIKLCSYFLFLYFLIFSLMIVQ